MILKINLTEYEAKLFKTKTGNALDKQSLFSHILLVHLQTELEVETAEARKP